MNSKLYFGKVSHTRREPIFHRFEYNTFMCYLDVDELPNVFNSSKFWSFNKRNLAYFDPKNYLGANSSIRQAVTERLLEETGVEFVGKIFLLTHITYFGHCFNPVSFYYCFDEQENLKYILSEINNTPWNERHIYVTNATEMEKNQLIKDEFQKTFHVSPFMDMEFIYRWQFNNPAERLIVNMDNIKSGQQWFNAHLQLEAETINSKTLNKALWRFPMMTIKVVFAIYWQALKLKLKGVTFYSNPKSV